MSLPLESDTDALLEQAAEGSEFARSQLLARHCRRLERLVQIRMDRRVCQRFDPVDVVQDALVEAHRKLPAYLEQRPLPFYLWLRQLVLERLIQLHRLHLQAEGRSVARELNVADESAFELAERLVSPGTSPTAGARRAENCERVRLAISELSENDREILVMRFLEQLEVREVAAVLGLSSNAVCARQLRAVRQLRKRIDKGSF